jgi:hypothetical protein
MSQGAGRVGRVGVCVSLEVRCVSAPLLGYFGWKYLDNEDSPHAGAAFYGWILGTASTLLFILMRFLAVGARVGAS